MEVSREDLTQRFERLSNEDLLASLRSGTLTPLATEVAGNILSSRGVDQVSLPGTADSTVESAVEIADDPSDLVTVSVQWDAMRANLLRTLLESHGIFVHMWGEHLGFGASSGKQVGGRLETNGGPAVGEEAARSFEPAAQGRPAHH